MQSINSAITLKQAIADLQQKKTAEEAELRLQLAQTYESVKPVNLIKSTFKEVSSSQEIKDGLIHTSAGLVAGYLFKKVYEGEHDGAAKQLVGAALSLGITNIVANNPQAVKMATHGAFSLLKLALHQMRKEKP
jgi:hypothetical protein